MKCADKLISVEVIRGFERDVTTSGQVAGRAQYSDSLVLEFRPPENNLSRILKRRVCRT